MEPHTHTNPFLHRVASRDIAAALGAGPWECPSPTPPTPWAAPLAQLREYAKAAKSECIVCNALYQFDPFTPIPPSIRRAEGKGGGAAAEGAAAEAVDLKPFEKQMASVMEHLQHELANIRTGRATPGMLDHLKIEAYGEKVPMKAVGSVSVRDSQLLAVTLFDPGLVEAVVAGIAASPLRLNPRAEGQEVLVPVPSPTTETLAAMGKVCKAEGETAKVSVRHARKTALDVVKGVGSEDGRRRAEKEVQQLTDKFIADIEAIVAAKQKDIIKHNS